VVSAQTSQFKNASGCLQAVPVLSIHSIPNLQSVQLFHDRTGWRPSEHQSQRFKHTMATADQHQFLPECKYNYPLPKILHELLAGTALHYIARMDSF
jgi:hypothetical protein